MDYYNGSQSLRDVIDLIRSGFFSRGDTELFRPLIDGLLHEDPYLLLADFQSYIECQQNAETAYRDTNAGRACRSSIPRAAANSPPTGRYASIARPMAREARADQPAHTVGSRNRIVRRRGSAAPHRSCRPR